MTTPSEDAADGWRKGDKTSQGLDAYELLARAHKAAQAEIESLAAQLIHRTQQRDNQIETIRELTAVVDERTAALTEANHLIKAQNITIENQTAALERQQKALRGLRRQDTADVTELQAKLQVAERRVIEAEAAVRLTDQENDKLRDGAERDAEVIADLRAQVENADPKTSADWFDEALRLKNLRIAERAEIDRLKKALDERNRQLDEQRQTTANAGSDHGRVPALLDAIDQIHKAVLGTLEVTSAAGSGVRKVAEVRRQQRLKYTVEHDAEHGLGDLVDAADALIHRDNLLWPERFDGADFRRITRLPETRYAHAAALLCAALDVRAHGDPQAHDSAS